MTIALITDQHLDGRKNSQVFWDYFLKFYDDVFFPSLDKYKIRNIIDLGDTFDNRKSIDLAAWHRIKKHYYDKLAERGIQVHMIVGNHTAYYKNTNKINTPELLLNSYGNIHIYSEVEDITVEGLKLTMLPWINSENYDTVFNHLNNTDSKIIMGHLEINGFQAIPGHVFEGGLKSESFDKFDKVFSGHFHHKSERGNIKYLGNPYELFWNDYKAERGFHLLDAKTQKLGFIKNPYRIFNKIFYNDVKNNYKNFNASEYKDMYIKIFIEERSNNNLFEQVLEKLYDTGVHDIKVIETDSLNLDNSEETFEGEDTLTTLNRYIDETENINLNKNSIKNIIKSIYVEACEVQ
jgi:DNA repair exonuclease SbcCD nuclease subunit